MKARTVSICIAALAACGCVERKMVITSEPSGALVYVSQVEVGRTPVTLPFTWYGDYDITLRLDGYQALDTHANLRPPLYEAPPLDLFSELAPWTCQDTRYLHFPLSLVEPVDDQELIRRAREMAQKLQEPAGR